jgi:rhodanese-related sulfurtransferase
MNGTKCSALAIAFMLLATSSYAAEGLGGSPTASTSQPAEAPQPAPLVTPANDPAYTYKTLRLNRAAFDALAARPEQLLILDIRRPDELTKLGGFPVYLSIQTNDVQRSLGYIPRDRLIVTVSNHAHRAGAIGDLLTGYGFHVIGAIGVLDYEAEGGTLTKIPVPPPRTAAVAAATASAPAPAK